MPSRAVTSFLRAMAAAIAVVSTNRVNALSGCYLISTNTPDCGTVIDVVECQCPLGLLPHFYIWLAHLIKREERNLCQCPLGLLPHFYEKGIL